MRTPENPLEYTWLTVDEAVAFCPERGLSRTPKTLRKWAERSDNKEDAEIAFLRDQLEKSQAEVGRRATSTDEALKTIDRVVHSFEMQAEANKALALQSANDVQVVPDATVPIRFRSFDTWTVGMEQALQARVRPRNLVETYVTQTAAQIAVTCRAFG